MKTITLGLLAILGMTAVASLGAQAAQQKSEPQWVKQFWEDQARRGGW